MTRMTMAAWRKLHEEEAVLIDGPLVPADVFKAIQNLRSAIDNHREDSLYVLRITIKEYDSSDETEQSLHDYFGGGEEQPTDHDL